ncbi:MULTISPECIES: hypothetical protein [Chelativorans]|jgi:hypothetical protein|uniref:hypothetical protein n=1 Tax=Chelativorans TaxID=449972 RepID=UPI0012EE0A1C|nr:MULTISPECIES: hypothetical protein [Chelativorans]
MEEIAVAGATELPIMIYLKPKTWSAEKSAAIHAWPTAGRDRLRVIGEDAFNLLLIRHEPPLKRSFP